MKFPTKLEELLPPAAMSRVLDLLSQPALTATVKEALQKVGLKDTNPITQIQDAWGQARGWVESVVQRVLEQSAASPAVVNATGALFDARWSSLPSDSVVVQAMAAAAVAFQDQSLLVPFAQRAACEATGAQAATFSCSITALTSALLETSRSGKGWVIGRTDIVRIPGSADLRALLSLAVEPVIELGAVNGVTPQEWREAFQDNGRSLLLVSPNNLDGGDAMNLRMQAVAEAKASGCRIVEILFDATLDGSLAERMQLPSLRERIESGTDLILAPLDGLLGGPTGALAIGKKDCIAGLQFSLERRGLQLSGAALAGAAVALQRSNDGSVGVHSPSQMLLTNIENLKERARRIALQIHNTSRVTSAEPIATESKLGPSPWSRYRTSSYAVAIEPRDALPESLQSQLADGRFGPTIWSRIEGHKLLFDLRLVDPADDHLLVAALTESKEPPENPSGESTPEQTMSPPASTL